MTSGIKRGLPSSFLTLTFGFALIAPFPASAQAIPPVATEHTIGQGRNILKYRAIFREKVLTDSTGAPAVTLSSIAYLRQGVKNQAKRPVMFLFNGGPGGSSSLLHLGAFGPRIAGTKKGEEAMLRDNPNTLLDSADLVFIDPPGTGLSRVLKPGSLGKFWGLNADTAAVYDLIDDWLKNNHRQASPVYLAGESYGGTRAALIAGQIADDKAKINVKGLLLISPALDYSLLGLGRGSDTSRLMQFSAMAAGAWYYGKIERKGRSLTTFAAQAQAFADKEYAPALKMPYLSDAQRSRVAEGMSRFIGVPKADILRANLRIDPPYYLAQLNGNKKLVTGQLDMRVTAPQVLPFPLSITRWSSSSALGIEESNKLLSSVATDYIHNELKVPGAQKYVSFSWDANARWNWLDADKRKNAENPQHLRFNFTPDIANLMKQRPDIKLMVVGGYYDLSVPVRATRYAIEHAGIAPQRIGFYDFPVGHTVFNASDDLSPKIALVRTFFKWGKPSR